MPLVDYNDPAVWASLYSDAEGRGYVRDAKQNCIGGHLDLRRLLGIGPGQSIILVGAGFGWIAEDWQDDGYGPVVALETSTWIHDNLEHASIPILQEDIGNHAAVAKALGASRARWCISEDVISALDDAEAVALSKRMRPMAETVAHWTTVKANVQDPRLNWKTLEEWKALLAPDLVVGRNDPRVL